MTQDHASTMLSRASALLLLALAATLVSVARVSADPDPGSAGVQRIDHVDRDNHNDRDGRGGYRGWIEQDPDLDVEVWTDNESGVYYTGENITIYFRASDDAFVTVYNIDTDGRVNLIFPYDRSDDPFIEGGRIYRIPGRHDDYDLEVRGPAGTENLVIVASRRPFPIPDWYDGPGIVCDRDRYDFIDYLNNRYFGCRSGCARAIDNVSYVVRDWDHYYYRPVYWDPWPVWGSAGSIYIDHWWGSSVYVNGVYYGCSPLFIPRVCAGYNTITIYDSDGHCWEDRVVIRNGSNRIDNTIIRTRPQVVSRYRQVRESGFRAPARNGYSGELFNAKMKPRTPQTIERTRERGVPLSGDDTRGKSLNGKSGATSGKGADSQVRGFRAVKRSAEGTASGQAKSERANTGSSSKRLEPYKTPESDATASGKAGSSRQSTGASSKRIRWSDGDNGGYNRLAPDDQGVRSGGDKTLGRDRTSNAPASGSSVNTERKRDSKQKSAPAQSAKVKEQEKKAPEKSAVAPESGAKQKEEKKPEEKSTSGKSPRKKQ